MPKTDDELSVGLRGRGVSRRDFMKWCAATAVALGVSATDVATALAAAAKAPLKPAIWLEHG